MFLKYTFEVFEEGYIVSDWQSIAEYFGEISIENLYELVANGCKCKWQAIAEYFRETSIEYLYECFFVYLAIIAWEVDFCVVYF